MANTIKIEGEVEDFLRKSLDKRLSQCTPEQVAFFHRIFANGVQSKDLKSAIDLCDRTIRKNLAGRNPL